MSTLESKKLITEKFLEDATNDGNVNSFQNELKNDIEKLILDELSNEKIENIDENQLNGVTNDLPESCPVKLTETDEDVEENLSEETESSRDLKITESEGPEEQSTADNAADVKIGEGDTKDVNNGDGDTTDVKKGDGDTTEANDEWQDLLGSGVIMKKILKEGISESRPQRSDKCFIDYTCRLEEADEETCADKAQHYEMALGEGDVVQGLDVAIGLMNKNEKCLLKIGSRLAFGPRGLPPSIPGDATVIFNVELVDVQKEDDFDVMSIQEKRRMGNKKRERGNWWYQRGENTLAIQCYRRALDFLDEVDNVNEEEKPTDTELQQLLEDRLKVLNNMASAQIKMELYDQAQTSLQSVLKCQPNNVKALFRKSKIFIAKNDLAQASKMLEKARLLEPEDPLILKEVNAVNGLISKQKNSEREYARRMFGSSSPTGAGRKSKGPNESKKSTGNKIQMWITLGATLFVGLAGVVAYKFKYP